MSRIFFALTGTFISILCMHHVDLYDKCKCKVMQEIRNITHESKGLTESLNKQLKMKLNKKIKSIITKRIHLLEFFFHHLICVVPKSRQEKQNTLP